MKLITSSPNWRQRFIAITKLLCPYQELWSYEVLYEYPRLPPLDDFFLHLTHDELYLLDGAKNFSSLLHLMPKYLQDLYQEINEQFFVPSMPIPPHYQATSRHPFLRIKGKKAHELHQMSYLVEPFIHQFNHILEFCGGLGHLSNLLTHLFSHIESTSLDIDSSLQNSGKKRYQFFSHANRIHYKKLDLLDPLQSPLVPPKTLAVGLHTCGHLAIRQMEICLKHSLPFINFGCCYYKVYEHNSYNISQWAKTHGLALTLPALTLATRSHAPISKKDFDYKYRVKRYRYAFHLFYLERYGSSAYPHLGNTHHTIYAQDFATYAREQFLRLKMSPHHLSNFELNSFFNAPKQQKELEKMIRLGIFRAEFGKVLEIYLLLDRLFFLEENNWQAELVQAFDAKLSPRNIGLLATPLNAGL